LRLRQHLAALARVGNDGRERDAVAALESQVVIQFFADDDALLQRRGVEALGDLKGPIDVLDPRSAHWRALERGVQFGRTELVLSIDADDLHRREVAALRIGQDAQVVVGVAALLDDLAPDRCAAAAATRGSARTASSSFAGSLGTRESSRMPK
jgi:hypothetical protein